MNKKIIVIWFSNIDHESLDIVNKIAKEGNSSIKDTNIEVVPFLIENETTMNIVEFKISSILTGIEAKHYDRYVKIVFGFSSEFNLPAAKTFFDELKIYMLKDYEDNSLGYHLQELISESCGIVSLDTNNSQPYKFFQRIYWEINGNHRSSVHGVSDVAAKVLETDSITDPHMVKAALKVYNITQRNLIIDFLFFSEKF